MDEVNETESAKTTVNYDGEVARINCKDDLTPYFEAWDHSVDKVYLSEVPEVCKREPCQLGIDEAGRGPVLGPMVYGVSYAPLSEKQILVDIGCADSKSLTEQKRDEIFDKVCKEREKIGWAVDAISPNTISNSMYRRAKTSLNQVSMNSAINLAQKVIESGARIAEIYVDTVGKPEKYQSMLENIFPGIKIKVEKKADSTYPIVSAASICAKVSRDHAIRAWQFREGSISNNFGSGYPTDPVTKQWLLENVDPVFGFPTVVRFSWSTAEIVLEKRALSVDWDEETEKEKGTRKISSFFAKSPDKYSQISPPRKRHRFFIDGCLSNPTSF
ncbi:ribonuclease H2 subunit A [Ceratina calcarata]|uniref:Ribonuclease n=1 Tax=Ceratina calcarata TaxID=156304 RepID=A0AAJ7J3R5_9HYME|nr:ribonuclease H2 subunit A [Ceratina calcarata]